jgi:hypothetical protein
VFRLPLRALQGFAQSLHDLAFATLPIPNYATPTRRAQTLDVQLPIVRDGDPIHLEVDTAKANEVRQYGYSKRCTWREVYLALDTRTRQVQAALMTHHDVADGNVLANRSTGFRPTNDLIAHEAMVRTTRSRAMPREGAGHWKATVSGAARCNGASDAIVRLGRREWKKGCGGYYCRSLAENAMPRLKTFTGFYL